MKSNKLLYWACLTSIILCMVALASVGAITLFNMGRLDLPFISVETPPAPDVPPDTPSIDEVPLPKLDAELAHIVKSGVSSKLSSGIAQSKTDGLIHHQVYELTYQDNRHLGYADNDQVFINYEILGHQDTLKLAPDAVNEVIRPLEDALMHYLGTNHDISVVVQTTLEYEKAGDSAPKFIRFEAYSAHDDGESVNWNVLINNANHDMLMDYANLDELVHPDDK